jgi:hypothetical protein
MRDLRMQWSRFKRLMCEVALRGASHYGRRSRGHQLSPHILQETKSLASWPFTLRPKSKGCRNLEWLLFEEGDDSRRRFGPDKNGNPYYGREAIGFFIIKKAIINKILTVRLEGLFLARNIVGCSFGFGLWAWPLEASHYGRPSWEAVGVHDQRFGLWRLHTMPGRMLQLLYFSGYFQPISLDSQQSLATQSHGLLTSTSIVRSGPNYLST